MSQAWASEGMTSAEEAEVERCQQGRYILLAPFMIGPVLLIVALLGTGIKGRIGLGCFGIGCGG